MSTAAAEPEVQHWVKKAEAASILAISTRQLERYTASGRIASRRSLIPGEKTERALYLLDDVHRLKSELDNRVNVGLIATRETTASVAGLLTREGPITQVLDTVAEAIRAQTAVLQQNTAPRLDKGWLTLDEAAPYSGLTVPTIAALIRDNQVFAMGRGPVTWRIQRESLDEWSRMVHQVPKKFR